MVDRHSHIELYEPKTDGDWADFAMAVAAQINRLKFGDSTMDAVDFLSLFLHKACAGLDVDDLQKVNNGIVALVNEALLAQKKEQGKKSNANKKKLANCNLDGGDDYYEYEEYHAPAASAAPKAETGEEPTGGENGEDHPAAEEPVEIDAGDYFKARAKAKTPKLGGGGNKGKGPVDMKSLQAKLAAQMSQGGAAKASAPKAKPSGPSASEKEKQEREELKRRMLAAQQEEEEEEEEEEPTNEPSATAAGDENPNARFKKEKKKVTVKG